MQYNEYSFTVSAEAVGERRDRLLVENVESLTRSSVQRLIDEECVLVNQKPTSKNYKLRLGDVVDLYTPELKELDVEAEDIPLEIVFEDEHLLVVNKPKGMVVHPAAGNYSGTLVNALMAHCKGSLSGINGVLRPGIVHRIDKKTSGLLIVAKSDVAHIGLAEQIKAHSFTRIYEAIVCGNLKSDSGTIDAPIGRHPVDRKKMCVTDKNSKHAVTHFEVLERYNGFTHIRVRLETGRTHQIRVHMAHIGHPVAGDEVYGSKKPIKELDGQCLHAKVIGFKHPVTHEYLEFESDLPKYFNDFIQKLKKMQ